MAAVSRKYLALESGKRVVRESETDEVIFTVVRIGGAGGKDISLVSGNFDFAAAKLVNLADGTAATDAATKGQMDTALAGKANTSHTHTASDITDFDAEAKAAAVADSITDGVTDVAPSQNAVFDALALKIDSSEKGAASGVATLDGGGKIPAAQLPASVMEYKGTFDPTGPTPNLTNGTGDAGDIYVVSVSGSHDFGAGPISFDAGDWVLYNGTIYQKSVNSNSVASVNGYTGVVVLDTDDVSDSGATNKYYATSLFDADFANQDTDDLAEGTTNRYYSSSLFDTDFGNKDSDDLAEGSSNLFFSETRFNDTHAKSFTNDNAGAITIRQLVYVKANGNVDLANAAVSNLDEFAVGLVKDASIASAGSGDIFVRPGAVVPGFSGLTPGKKVYLHNSTLGSYTQDPTTIGAGNYLYAVGRAVSATELLFQPDLNPVQV